MSGTHLLHLLVEPGSAFPGPKQKKHRYRVEEDLHSQEAKQPTVFMGSDLSG